VPYRPKRRITIPIGPSVDSLDGVVLILEGLPLRSSACRGLIYLERWRRRLQLNKGMDGSNGYGNFRLVGPRASNVSANEVRVWRFQGFDLYG